jgi:hypothetical protein
VLKSIANDSGQWLLARRNAERENQNIIKSQLTAARPAEGRSAELRRVNPQADGETIPVKALRAGSRGKSGDAVKIF